jgi:hypothetical protein
LQLLAGQTPSSSLAAVSAQGEGHFRISAFDSRADAGEVARRLQALKW